VKIDHLLVENYRNFATFKLEFNSSGAIISGKNGIGKTNLLEAVAYPAFGRSFQTNHDRDLIKFGNNFFRISADFTYKNENLTIDAAYSSDQKKIKINSRKISRLSELFKYVKVVYFSPRDIDLTSGNPGFRRSFFDLAISQNSFKYMELLKEYSRILKQRNALLKTNFGQEEKKSWDMQFVRVGSEIISFRKKYLLDFIPELTEYHSFISGNNDNLSAKYVHSFPHNGTGSLNDSFFECLDLNEKRELENQRSMYGPHLDDILFMINGHPYKRFGSQGQKRSLAISARLVQAKLISDADDEFPILMFDDVLADLDEGRTARILELLKTDHQIFIATPNKSHYQKVQLPEIDLEILYENE